MKWIIENYNFAQMGVRREDLENPDIYLDKRSGEWELYVDPRLKLGVPKIRRFQFLGNAIMCMKVLVEELNSREQ